MGVTFEVSVVGFPSWGPLLWSHVGVPCGDPLCGVPCSGPVARYGYVYIVIILVRQGGYYVPIKLVSYGGVY
jgi:hypothetical protein